MDTGLAGDIPVFIIETLEFETDDGTQMARLELHEPVNEDPAFSLFFEPGTLPGHLLVKGRDNNGNRFKGTLVEGGTH